MRPADCRLRSATIPEEASGPRRFSRSYFSGRYISATCRVIFPGRVGQIRQRYHGQLVVHIAVDRGLESLPRAVVMNAPVPVPLVNKPAKTIVARIHPTTVRLAALQLRRSPHQIQARPLQQFFRVQRGVPLSQIDNREIEAAVSGRIHHRRNPLLIFQFAFH